MTEREFLHRSAMGNQRLRAERDALGDRADIVRGVASEGDHTKRPASTFVLPREILLVHQPAIPLDQNRVDVERGMGSYHVGHRFEAGAI